MTSLIVWLRQDLRLDDNPALYHACQHASSVYPLYIQEDKEANWPIGSASKVWLHHAIKNLQLLFKKKSSTLILRQGNVAAVLDDLIAETGSEAVYWNRRYEPYHVQHDKKLKQDLNEKDIVVKSYPANLLHEPHEIINKQGNPYKVFTPFWKNYLALGNPVAPLPPPDDLKPVNEMPYSMMLDDYHLLPEINWDKGIREYWGQQKLSAEKQVKQFTEQIDDYPCARDFPAEEGVSRLSPYLHFGQISVRQVWHHVIESETAKGQLTPSYAALSYLRQLVWRDFAHHLLFHFPDSDQHPLRSEFAQFPWRNDDDELRNWQKGLTGYPIVDAGMRQLWNTGWMHNRVRMIVASFLIKDLLIDWRKGAEWFWDTLVDADLANNSMGWQWVAGCGADAAPYFRIFNPVTQSEKFDAEGNYIRQWVPELRSLDSKWIHKPWLAPDIELENKRITLGKDYPRPIVDHAEARTRALAALASIKSDA